MPKALVLGGATGLLGKALMATLKDRGWETGSLGREDGDILNFDFIKTKLEEHDPDVIFNTIAWTQVDAAEDHQEEALELNRTFPDSLARSICNREKGHLVHFSTDFVFSGVHAIPFKEDDPTHPENVYGETKLEGEKVVLKILPERSCILRTAWLFGPGRKNFVQTIIDASKDRDQLSVVDDQVGSPTYTMDLALWSALLAEKRMTGVWHASNSGQASWCELALEAVNLARESVRIEPISSDQWPQKARRPKYTVLDNSKLTKFLGTKPRPWPTALRDYVYSNFKEIQGENKR